MRWPLRNQMMAPLLAVAVCSLAAVGAIQARLSALDTRDRIERQIQGVVGVVSASNFPLTAAVLRKMRDLAGAEFVVTDRTGRIVASSHADLAPPWPDRPRVSRPEEVELGRSETLAGGAYFYAAMTLDARAAGSGGGEVLHVLFSRDAYLRSWRAALAPPIAVALAAVIAAAGAAHVLAGRISRTTQRLGREVGRMAHGDFSPATLPAADDEIRDLVIAVNQTAALLTDYERDVRRTERMRTMAQLGASLAHEMRNAATGCRLAVDLHSAECPHGADNESLDVARRQLRLMESQLQRLLQLGRDDNATAPSDVPLRQLLQGLIPLLSPAAHHAQAKLECRLPEEELWVDGDAAALEQAALNLGLNAIEAVQQGPAGQGGERRVTIALHRNVHGEAELTVSDTGPGPAAATTSDLFEPFATSKPEGAGLGLAVVKQAVDAHRGAIAWDRQQGVTHFRVTLPAVQREAVCAES
ncbi:MAG TPA: ATP-binding protein [Lacipirellulaceae bacterium]|nr:ATP-binding protein [Lacipirellulaceae bacterium]